MEGAETISFESSAPVTYRDLLNGEGARERIAKTITRTPLIRLELGPDFPDIWLKLENLQPINAYKLRGAANAAADQPTAPAADQAATAPDAGIEEIVVSALKRDQTLSTVPAAITALSANALTTQGVVTGHDLPNVLPNIQVAVGAKCLVDLFQGPLFILPLSTESSFFCVPSFTNGALGARRA